MMRGKNQTNVEVLHAGDIGALSKLQLTNTGDTLCEQSKIIKYPEIHYPDAGFSKAVYAAKQGEEDKVFGGLYKLQEEDPSIKVEKNAETNETILSGQGELHLDVISSKLQSKFGGTADLRDMRIPTAKPLPKPYPHKAGTKSRQAATASLAMYG